METEIKKIPGIKTYGHAKNRTPTLYFNLNGVEPIAMYHHLAKLKVNAPASNFYSIEPSRALGLGDAGAVRAGLAPYSTRGEVDRLIEGINSFTL